MLVHKDGQINNVQLITGLRIAEMSQRQGEGRICKKNGSYCENEKSQGGGQGRCEWRSEAFVKIQKKIKKNFGSGGVGLRGGGGGGGVRVDVNLEVKLL